MSDGGRNAILYRMATEDHLCPFGLKSLDLLEREGFEVEDNRLTTKVETEAFKAEHGVKTTPRLSSMENASAATRRFAATSASR